MRGKSRENRKNTSGRKQKQKHNRDSGFHAGSDTKHLETKHNKDTER